VSTGPKPKRGLPPVDIQPIDGVRLRRHPLDIEAGRLNQLAHRLGARLRFALRGLPDNEVPDKDWREGFELYSETVMALLREQRMRAGIKSDGTDVPDEGSPLTAAELAELKEFAAAADAPGEPSSGEGEPS
jgi:hypothetical protein